MTDRPRDKIDEIILVGKIENIHHPGNPASWAAGLGYSGYLSCEEYVGDRPHMWSSEVNCNQLACHLLKQFQLDWPGNLPVVGDMNAMGIDFAILSILFGMKVEGTSDISNCISSLTDWTVESLSGDDHLSNWRRSSSNFWRF
eukprot:TRINITY_DN12979_c0_g1_i1.p1 TRINITY_DN12979_c0_g1~~TRINITY_DN12979_c0_g1_i1.p1  ORF type:complete len:143 (-),score=12.53 TRINITY_DN12979_c0_g1_i1:117-545(-)